LDIEKFKKLRGTIEAHDMLLYWDASVTAASLNPIPQQEAKSTDFRTSRSRVKA
jgi:hypothetical protein